MASAQSGAWGACRFCGVATRAGSPVCEICGAAQPIPAAELAHVPRALRRRLRLTGALRSSIVVVVVVGLAYLIVSAVLQGPPVLTGDPLTTAGGYAIGAGNSTVIYGEITGGDYVIGNFSSYAPLGANIALSVYNTSNWDAYRSGGVASSAYTIAPSPSARIVFSAPTTETYYFVFSNPYPVSSHLTVSVYIATQYESNVGNSGFA